MRISDWSSDVCSSDLILALNASNGAVLWQATASLESGSVFGAASPAEGEATIVAGFSSGEVQAYRYESGRDPWEDAKIGSVNVRTPVTYSFLVWRLVLEKKKNIYTWITQP